MCRQGGGGASGTRRGERDGGGASRDEDGGGESRDPLVHTGHGLPPVQARAGERGTSTAGQQPPGGRPPWWRADIESPKVATALGKKLLTNLTYSVANIPTGHRAVTP